MNASSRPGSTQKYSSYNKPGLILADGATPPLQQQGPRNAPEARPQTVAARAWACRGCVPPEPAQIPQEFVTLHQVEIVPTGPDPQRDPQFLAMHGGSGQRQRRGRARWQPYPTSVRQPQRSSAMGRGIPIRSDARNQQFHPSPASMSQSRSLTSTGVINQRSHTNHGQPRTQPRLTLGPQRQPQQSQVVDTNIYLSPYGGYVYQSPDMARLDPSAGRHIRVACSPTTQGKLTQSDTQHPG